jgi:hypothetical protein
VIISGRFNVTYEEIAQEWSYPQTLAAYDLIETLAEIDAKTRDGVK